jgi:LPXTG-site transpeptidase (sortase) family protein
VKFLNCRFVSLFALIAAFAAIIPSAAAYEAVTLAIPSLNVESTITEFPLNGSGWEMDPWENAVGHLQGTAWFDEPGNIALGGHSTMPDFTPGVFISLNEVSVGDEVVVQLGGEMRKYSVTGITSVSPDDLSILYPTPAERLTLITCDITSYDKSSELYLRRTVVTAERIA